MQTRVVYEIDEPSILADAVVAGLSLSFRSHCGELDCSVTARCTTLANSRVADAIVSTAGIAQNELDENPATEMCIYLSPRVLMLDTNPITSTIFVIRNRIKLLAARVQVIHDERLRPTVQRLLCPEVEIAHSQLFGDRAPTTEDNELATIVSRAISAGYTQAGTLLSPVGSA